ncbi:hypothetical protein EJ04DRAFT_87291 [Polyplosphaeria fusca]|uniref:Uncharacterized protein n=1 Tax=Polyplosphaeria fusca TaxID=682080 RepID=A0A9P4R331_9PLEO|nr:hypothetical protein EJ04DRAFT_87291 [Polyplosphaeria fusca]
MAFDRIITRVELNKGAIITHETAFDPRPGTWFSKFTHDKIKDEGTKNALACMFACEEAYSFFYETISQIFIGLDIKIEELRVMMRNTPLSIVTKTAFGTFSNKDWGNTLLRVECNIDKRAWVIDLSSPQYGMNTVYEWKDFRARYLYILRAAYAFGTYEKLWQALRTNGFRHLESQISSDAKTHMNKAIESFTGTEGIELATMLNSSESAFCIKQERLLKLVKREFQRFVKAADYTDLLCEQDNSYSMHTDEDGNEFMEANVPNTPWERLAELQYESALQADPVAAKGFTEFAYPDVVEAIRSINLS